MPAPPDIQLANVSATTTAVIRAHVEPAARSALVPASCGEVWSYFRDAGLPRPGRNVALFLPDGVVEAGAEVAAAFPAGARIVASQLPAGRVVTMTHLGPYPGLGRTHAAIREWCTANGHRLTGVCWEVYGHWDPAWNTDPSQIRTDVFHLLAE